MDLAPVCTAAVGTVQNECLAECQGLAVLHRGQCSGGSVAFRPAAASPGKANVVAAGTATRAVMDLFAKEGFVFVGAAATADGSSKSFSLPEVTPEQLAR
jgi:hypothetical protein